MEQEYPDSVRIFPNNDNSNGEIDVTVFFRVNGEEHRLRIYKNNRKEEGDKRPDLLVTLRLNGKELEANSWQKEAKESGKIYYQGTPKPKSEGYSKSGSFKEVITEKREEKSVVKGFDDEIPF